MGGVHRIVSSPSRRESCSRARRLSLLFLVAMLSSLSAWADAYKTLSFPDDNSNDNKKNNYTSSWTAKIGSDSWTVTNFNNNNWTSSWTYIKCGRKNNASVASIATDFAIDKAVSSVVVTIDKVTTDYVNSVKLLVASDKEFSSVVETVTASSITKGDMTFAVTTPAAGYYYKLVFDCASASSNGVIQISKVVYNVDESVTSTKCSTPSFSIASQSFTAGSTLSVELSCGNPENATIYYTTDGNDPTTSSKVYDGAITVSTTTTIKAMAVDPAGTLENSSIATATYTAIEQSLYKKITSTDDLEDGAAYIIVSESAARAMTSTISSGHFASEKITKGSADNTFYSPATNDIIFEKNDNGYTLKNSAENYIGYNSSTDFSVIKNIGTSTKYTWMISFTSSGNVNIQNYSDQDRYIKYYDDNSDFRAYASGGTVIQLYKKESSTGSLTVGGENASGCYGTYYDERPFIMPADVIGYTIPESALSDGTIDEKSCTSYGENAVVPAKTALLLYALESGTYTFDYTTSTAEAPTDNLLRGGDMTELGSGYKFYKLAYADANKTDLGFYYGAADGAAFTLTNAHHAFLAVPEASAAKAFVIGGGNVTAINGVGQDTTAADAPVYSLSGVRMDGGNLPKGVYIKGGKKFVKK